MSADEDLVKSIAHHSPSSVLAVGEAVALASEIDVVNVDSLDGIRSQGRYRLAYVRNCLEHCSLDEGRQILAALRDVHAEIVYAHTHLNEEGWNHERFAELGFRQVAAYGEAESLSGLFYFDIYHYKLTPDWLNARFWANPEHWDIWEESTT